MRISLLLLIIAFSARMSGQSEPMIGETDDFLETLLKRDSTFYKEYVEGHELQILYTQINRDNENIPHFVSHEYKTDSSTYFYPASTVKLPVAALALEKLRSVGIVDLWSPMLTDSILEWQTPMLRDSLGTNGYPTLGDHIKKTLIYSDNNSFNRLFEYLGPEHINNRLKALGIMDTRIVHRLSIPLSPEQNETSNPIYFLGQDLDTLLFQPQKISHILYEGGTISKGIGYIDGGEYIAQPMDFSLKNKFPLHDQQEVLKRILFPKSYDPTQRFDIADEDYDFLLNQISTVPRISGYPSPIADFPDSYAKNFLYDPKTGRMLDNIKIFNKIGVAYGFMIDNAYVIDLENDVEFLLSSMINVNINQVYNDNTYEYDTIGYPFMLALSQLIYQFELDRERSNTPDLSKFKTLGKN